MATHQIESASVERMATGPRTPQGKERSKHNAAKHGIFSKAALLKDESKADFDSLLSGLRKDFDPEGTLEDVLVEKLATLLWRYRRLIVAEGAEVRNKVEFLEWDQQNRQFDEAERIEKSSQFGSSAGLIRKIENPGVLEWCLDFLLELRERIAKDGFDEERDREVLDKIYGSPASSRFHGSLFRDYFVWLLTARASDEERQSEGFATPEECQQSFVCSIDTEIRRLKLYRKEHAAVEASRAKLEALRQNVPDSAGLDRLLRYEASLERSFDRTLKQLERLQRMRLGLAVPPSVDVNISS
ncbi:MAG: hypothetical protein ACYDCU_07195 [Candidatus Acidiferrales bacterium]